MNQIKNYLIQGKIKSLKKILGIGWNSKKNNDTETEIYFETGKIISPKLTRDAQNS
jgi:hypothetical protein